MNYVLQLPGTGRMLRGVGHKTEYRQPDSPLEGGQILRLAPSWPWCGARSGAGCPGRPRPAHQVDDADNVQTRLDAAVMFYDGLLRGGEPRPDLARRPSIVTLIAEVPHGYARAEQCQRG
jgi:hypothetical protein